MIHLPRSQAFCLAVGGFLLTTVAYAGVNFGWSKPIPSVADLLKDTTISDRLKADQIAPQVLRAMADKGQSDTRWIIEYLIQHGQWRVPEHARRYLRRHIYPGAVEQYRERNFKGATFRAGSEVIE